MSFKIGEASWDEEHVSTQNRPQGDRKKIPFLRMEFNKTYKIRIISKPYRYFYKWARKADGKQVKLNSSLTEDCPLCADGQEPTVGWYAKVLYRDLGASKVMPAVLDFGKQIMKGIKSYQNNPDFGQDVHGYDLTITKGAKGSQPLYTVQASPPKALSDDEKAIARAINKKEIDGKANPDYIDLEERCKPLPPDTIRKILSGEASAPAAEAGTDENGVFEEESEAASKPVVKPEAKTEVKAEVKTETKVAPKTETKGSPKAGASNTESVKANDDDFLDF